MISARNDPTVWAEGLEPVYQKCLSQFFASMLPYLLSILWNIMALIIFLFPMYVNAWILIFYNTFLILWKCYSNFLIIQWFICRYYYYYSFSPVLSFSIYFMSQKNPQFGISPALFQSGCHVTVRMSCALGRLIKYTIHWRVSMTERFINL